MLHKIQNIVGSHKNPEQVDFVMQILLPVRIGDKLYNSLASKGNNRSLYCLLQTSTRNAPEDS